MSGLRLTDHARRRMQQRGLRERDIERVLDVGRTKHQPGAMLVYVDKRGRRALAPDEQRLSSVYVVIEGTEHWIVTVGHRTQNLRLH